MGQPHGKEAGKGEDDTAAGKGNRQLIKDEYEAPSNLFTDAGSNQFVHTRWHSTCSALEDGRHRHREEGVTAVMASPPYITMRA